MVKINKKTMLDKMEKLYELNIPNNPLTSAEYPSKARSRLSRDKIPGKFIGKERIFNDMPDDDKFDGGNGTKEIQEDVDKIKRVLQIVVSLYKGKTIEVKRRGRTKAGIMYDVYFENNHTILYVQPDNKKVILINRNMDADYFSDVLEDIQEIEKERADRNIAKLLVDIVSESVLPMVSNVAVEDETASDFEDEMMDTDIPEEQFNSDQDTDELELDIDPVKQVEDDKDKKDEEKEKEEAEAEEDEPEEDEPEEDEPEEDEEKKEKKEKLNDSIINNKKIMEDKNMKKVKDIKDSFGYILLVNEGVDSVSQYFNEDKISKFDELYVRTDGRNYESVYGVLGHRGDNRAVVTIVENNKYVFDGVVGNRDAVMFEQYETVKVDLAYVKGTFAQQINNFVRKNQGYAIIESVENGIVKIAQNKKVAQSVGGVPIETDALIKIEKKDYYTEDYDLNEESLMDIDLILDATLNDKETRKELKEQKETEDVIDINNGMFKID